MGGSVDALRDRAFVIFSTAGDTWTNPAVTDLVGANLVEVKARAGAYDNSDVQVTLELWSEAGSFTFAGTTSQRLVASCDVRRSFSFRVVSKDYLVLEGK